MTRYALPANDSLPFLFQLKDPNGTLVVINTGYTVGLTIRDSAGTSVFTAAATFDNSTTARLLITPSALGTAGLYQGAIRAASATDAHTYAFELLVTSHA